MSHILFKHLTRFTRIELENPQGYQYNSIHGMWVSNQNQEDILVKSTGPGKPIRGTKKHDVETGEDLKGQ